MNDDELHYTIKEVGYRYGTTLSIETDVYSLPVMLRRLAELGYDLTAAHKALSEAVEEQRKRKALDEAVKAMTKPTETEQ